MRTLYGTALRLLILGNVLITPVLVQRAQADTTTFYSNNSQFGMNLPQVTLPTGSDEIRTSDGTTCHSSVGGNGTYMDVGVIGTPGGAGVNSSASAYGRVVMPLGYQAKRLDCSRLYNIEIERLRMELSLARMGMTGSTTAAPASGRNWATEGWGNNGGGVPKKAPKLVAQPTSDDSEPMPVSVPKVKKIKHKPPANGESVSLY